MEVKVGREGITVFLEEVGRGGTVLVSKCLYLHCHFAWEEDAATTVFARGRFGAFLSPLPLSKCRNPFWLKLFLGNPLEKTEGREAAELSRCFDLLTRRYFVTIGIQIVRTKFIRFFLPSIV